MPRHPSELGPFIEATNLDPAATHDDIRALVRDAIRVRVAAVCVFPFWVPLVVDPLLQMDIPAATVVSWPHGLDALDTKLGAMELAAMAGVQEANVVLNPVYLANRDWVRVEEEVRRVVQHLPQIKVKVLFNAGRVSTRQIRQVVQAAENTAADFVGLFADSDMPAREDLEAAYLATSRVEILAAGNYTHNLSALRAVNVGAARISSQFPSRLVGMP